MRGKEFVKRCLSGWPATSLRLAHRGVASCLMYHRIVDAPLGVERFHPNAGLCVSVSEFSRQMELLRADPSLRPTPVEDLRDALEKGEEQEHTVVVTFDDGYLDNYELALPVLERFEIPAIIFIAPDLVDGTARLWWEELEFHINRLASIPPIEGVSEHELDIGSLPRKRKVFDLLGYHFKHSSLIEQHRILHFLDDLHPDSFSYGGEIMNWELLSEIASHELVSIGAHTMSHCSLAKEKASDSKEQIFNSKKSLEEKLGISVDFFAYPYGEHGQASGREFVFCDEVGFDFSFTTRFAHIHPRHLRYPQALPRLTIDYFDTIESFRQKLSGVIAMGKNRTRTFVTD